MDEVRREVYGRIAAVTYPQPIGRGKNIEGFRSGIVERRRIGKIARYERVSIIGTVPVARCGNPNRGKRKNKGNGNNFCHGRKMVASVGLRTNKKTAVKDSGFLVISEEQSRQAYSLIGDITWFV
jgi:hypothetical protein